MIPSINCVNIIKKFEGLKLKAYPDPGSGGLPITIGYGSTMYDDGKRINLGDVITEERATELLYWEVKQKSSALKYLRGLNQNQFDAIVSFVYNVGIGAFESSTLKRLIVNNPSNPLIRDQFERWNKSRGRILNGLTKRRKEEADLYFS